MPPFDPPQPDKLEHSADTSTRVLVVDEDGALHRRVSAACSNWHVDARIARVDSFLKAMGQVVRPVKDDLDDSDSNSPAQAQPFPHVLLGQLSRLQGRLRDNAQALKTLSPDTRLILIAPAEVNGQAEQAIAAGFDQVLVEPIADETLADAIQPDRTGVEKRLTPGGDSISADHTVKESTPTSTQVTKEEQAASSSPLDSAVIEQMLNPHGAALDQALAVIRNQPGLADVQFSEAARKPWHHVAVDVTFGEKTYGALHCPPPVETEQLQPWADWLARWHAMQSQVNDLWLMSMTDELTGAWNLRYFKRHLQMAIDRANVDGSAVTLMLFDIDNFKQYNDQFGHGAGDDILCETVRLIKSAIREDDVVARIGGDEFAVIFWDAEEPRRSGSKHPVDIEKITSRFRKLIRNYSFPKLAECAPGKLTISAGLAGYPLDGKTQEELVKKADDMLLESKRQGKDAIQFGPGAKQNGNSNGD